MNTACDFSKKQAGTPGTPHSDFGIRAPSATIVRRGSVASRFLQPRTLPHPRSGHVLKFNEVHG